VRDVKEENTRVNDLVDVSSRWTRASTTNEMSWCYHMLALLRHSLRITATPSYE